PRISLSIVTTVSADRTIDPETREATSIPFSLATRVANTSGASPAAGVSSIDAGTTVNGYPRMLKSSFRLGDCDASTRFMCSRVCKTVRDNHRYAITDHRYAMKIYNL